MSTNRGSLFLIPTPISPQSLETLSPQVINAIHGIRTFIVENARTARRFIKTTSPPYAIAELEIHELNKHENEAPDAFLQAALAGSDIGLMSEAGCPAVGDPGSQIVRAAHALNIPVKPLSGPSSILLALMASGMNGQEFTFHGYLSAKRAGLKQDLRRLETAARDGSTHIFIEAPYRNTQMVEVCLEVLADGTRLCIACDITADSEDIQTKQISEWRNVSRPQLHKRPTIYLVSVR